MIDALNRWIKEGRLPLEPFSRRGLSTTTTSTGVLFARLEETSAGASLRLFTNAAPLVDAAAEDASTLLALLCLNGPAARFGAVRLGIDPAGRYLWAVGLISADDPAAVQAGLTSYLESADKLRSAAIECLSRRTAADETDRSPEAASDSKTTSTLSQEELSSLMANPGVLWG